MQIIVTKGLTHSTLEKVELELELEIRGAERVE